MCLIKRAHLHSQVINFYMNLVMSRSEQDGGGRKVYSFSTFLFPKLHCGGHAAVRRWTKAVDLFMYDIILIPLHLGVHWALAVSIWLYILFALQFRSAFWPLQSYSTSNILHSI